MEYTLFMMLGGLVLGLAAVAANPSPYYAALGLVAVAGLGCGVLAGSGGSFLSLVLFLIYLGGMLVVFGYSAALAAEPYPETWGSWRVLGAMGAYLGGVCLSGMALWGGWGKKGGVLPEEGVVFVVLRGDMGGVAELFSMGGTLLVVSAWALLLTLFVVLELTRGSNRGVLRAV